MANYKLVDADQLDADLTRVANAIRDKGGYANTMAFPDEFVQEISAIETGSGETEKPFDCHSVTFMDGDTVLWVRSVADGDTCADVVERGLVEAPTKESTAQYNYTFYGWGASDGGAADSTILQNITEDKVVYAIYSKAVRYYTITWLDEDGETVLNTTSVAYGSVPSYTPTKEGYAFDYWTPTPTAVTGDASYVAVWSSVVASGTFSTGVAWAVYADGTLKISGTGAIPDYIESTSTKYGSPTQAYKTEIVKVVVEDGVTRIGDYAFYMHNAILTVDVADSVTSIGDYAFSYCTSLTGITIPDSVTTIGERAFYECDSLISITIPDSVTVLGGSSFYNCTSLESVIIGNGVTSIGNRAFWGCTSLESITIPDSVTSIGNYAFRSTNLTNAVFENTDGWYVATTSGATSGTDVDVSAPATAATYLKTTYLDYYWYRNA